MTLTGEGWNLVETNCRVKSEQKYVKFFSPPNAIFYAEWIHICTSEIHHEKLTVHKQTFKKHNFQQNLYIYSF